MKENSKSQLEDLITKTAINLNNFMDSYQEHLSYYKSLQEEYRKLEGHEYHPKIKVRAFK